MAIKLIMVAIQNSDLHTIYPHLNGTTISFAYLYGPFIYIYANIIGLKLDKLPKRYCLHFIPFLIINILCLFFVYFESPEFKLSLVEQKPTNLAIILIDVLKPIHGVIYTILILFKLKSLKIRLKANYSRLDISTYNYLKYLVLGNLGTWIIVVLTHLIGNVFTTKIEMLIVIYIPFSFLIILLGWKSLYVTELNLPKEDENKPNKEENRKSYKKSGLSEETAVLNLTKLNTLMNSEKPYLDSNLKLSDLANLMEITQHNLSEILNTQLEQTFYDYVNTYRINEVKELIKNDPGKEKSLISIAFEAGFSSKSSFNTTFKRIEGITPSEFRNFVFEQN